jgi:predicted DNA-binding transcriptional regulator YafY
MKTILIQVDCGELTCAYCLARNVGGIVTCRVWGNILTNEFRLPQCLAAQKEAAALVEVAEQVKATMSVETPEEVLSAIERLDAIRAERTKP